MQVLLCAVQLLKIGKQYSFWEFFCFNWEKIYFLALGMITKTGVGFIARKITADMTSSFFTGLVQLKKNQT